MKEDVLRHPDEEKDLHSTEGSLNTGSLNTGEEKEELAHIQLTRGRFILVLVGLVLAIFLVGNVVTHQYEKRKLTNHCRLPSTL